VHPAAALPEHTADVGGAVIEIDLDPILISRIAAISLRGEAGELVPKVVG
jgi:NAD-dependent SIR2 family protein deacetylase